MKIFKVSNITELNIVRNAIFFFKSLKFSKQTWFMIHGKISVNQHNKFFKKKMFINDQVHSIKMSFPLKIYLNLFV